MLHDDAVHTQRQADDVALLPGILHAVDRGVALAFQDQHHLVALELQAAGAAAGRNLLLEENVRRDRGVLNRWMQIPAHQPLAADLEWQFELAHDLQSVALLVALAVAHDEDFVPVIDFGEPRFAVFVHGFLSSEAFDGR